MQRDLFVSCTESPPTQRSPVLYLSATENWPSDQWAPAAEKKAGYPNTVPGEDKTSL